MVTPRTSAGTFPAASATAPSSGRRSSSTSYDHWQDRITPVREPAAAADGESGNEDLIDGGELENDYDGVGDGESFL